MVYQWILYLLSHYKFNYFILFLFYVCLQLLVSRLLSANFSYAGKSICSPVLSKDSPLRPGVSKRCRPSWLTNSALVNEPKYGAKGGVAGSQPISIAVHRSPNKLWRSNSIFNLCLRPMLHECRSPPPPFPAPAQHGMSPCNHSYVMSFMMVAGYHME